MGGSIPHFAGFGCLTIRSDHAVTPSKGIGLTLQALWPTFARPLPTAAGNKPCFFGSSSCNARVPTSSRRARWWGGQCIVRAGWRLFVCWGVCSFCLAVDWLRVASSGAAHVGTCVISEQSYAQLHQDSTLDQGASYLLLRLLHCSLHQREFVLVLAVSGCQCHRHCETNTANWTCQRHFIL